MSGLVIRPATEVDRDAWMELFRGYNAFYGVTLDDGALADIWRRVIDPSGGFLVLLALLDGRAVGLANCLVHPNTWSKAPDCYLEDLFVEPDQRGRGIARRLFETLAELRTEHGWRKVWWKTLSGNMTAQRLYDRVGRRTDWLHYEIGDDPAT